MIRFPRQEVDFGRDFPEVVYGHTIEDGLNQCTESKEEDKTTDGPERISEDTLAGPIRGEDAAVECQDREFDQSEAWALYHGNNVASLPELSTCCSSGRDSNENKKVGHIPAQGESDWQVDWYPPLLLEANRYRIQSCRVQ